MSYEKNTWKTGDIITSKKLNHMEDGIAGGILVIGGFTPDEQSHKYTGMADKTWQEIDNALAAGVRCVIVVGGMGGHKQLNVSGTKCDDEKYYVSIQNSSTLLTTTSADGYPTDGGFN